VSEIVVSASDGLSRSLKGSNTGSKTGNLVSMKLRCAEIVPVEGLNGGKQ